MLFPVTAAPPGCEWVRVAPTMVLVRTDVRAWVLPMLQDAGRAAAPDGGRDLAGGRGGARLVTAAEHEVVVRACRRGGLPARLLHDTYFGWNPRPFRELSATETLRQRGAPVVEVYGAAVHWMLPGCYRGSLATRYMPGAHTLWEWARRSSSAAGRVRVFRAVAGALRRLHTSGARHPDLNLNNILVCPGDSATHAPAILFIDFDRARLMPTAQRAFETDLDRLARSARKLDPRGRSVAAADLDTLRAAYREHGPCA